MTNKPPPSRSLSSEHAPSSAEPGSPKCAVFLVGPDQMIKSWSPEAEQLLGYPPPAVIGQPMALLSKILESVQQRGCSEALETALVRSDGCEVPVRLVASPVHDVEGRTISVAVIVEDLRAPQWNEYEPVEPAASTWAREREGRLGRGADPSPVLIWIADDKGSCIYVNQPGLDFTGTRLEQHLGEAWLEGMHPDDRQHAQDIWYSAFAARREVRFEYRLRLADGAYRWVLVSGAPRFAPDGRFEGYLGSCVDIDDHKQAESRLAVAQQRTAEQLQQLELLYRTAPVGRCFIDSELRFLRVNERLAAMTGRPVPDHIDRKLPEIFPDLAEQLEPICGLVLKCGEPVVDVEIRVPAAAGQEKERDWLVSCYPLSFGEGDLPGINMVLQDISEHRRAEKEIATHVRQQAAIAELGQAALTDEDLETFMGRVVALVAETLGVDYVKILELLPGNRELLLRAGVGWKPGSVGMTTVENNRDSQAGYTLLSESPVIVEDFTTESRFRGPVLLRDHAVISGMSVIIPGRRGAFGVLGAHTKSPRRFDDRDSHFLQAVANLLAASVDRRKTEEELRAERDYSATILAGAPVIVCGIDADGVTTFMNPAGEQITGYAAVEVVGRNWCELFCPEHERERMRHLTSETDRRIERDIEMTVRMRHGEPHTILWNFMKRNAAAGHLVEIIGFGNDITRRKQLEEQLRHSQKMEAIGRLAGGIAHDFNNLLTVISGYCELILEDLPKDSAIHSDVEEVHKAAERAISLTRQLLAFSRRQVLQPRRINLSSVIADSEKMLQRLIGENIELVTHLDPELGWVRADQGQVEQVLLNLAVNAHDAMPDGGRLTIETANVKLNESALREGGGVAPGPHVMLTMRDTGVGMDAATQARVFEPFFTTKDQGKGTGLGLSTVYGIIKQSGGGIWVESGLGKGTTFRVCLPRVAAPAEKKRPRTERRSSLHGSETVLLVEDEASVRRLTRTILESQGYRVMAAADGVEALELLSTKGAEVDLLLTDVLMPRMGGQELAEQFPKYSPRPRVIFMSGHTHHAIPAAPFLQKPLSPLSLLRKLREVLDAPSIASQAG